MNIREAIDEVVSGRSLDMADASDVMREIMQREATPAQLGSFLTALRLKGETTQELAGMASVMREFALKVDVDGTVVDTVGTGGDGSNSFNISTATAFVAAGAGLKVAKHGNRAASSSCGSADVLEALGANIELTPQAVARCINEVGVGYMFAQAFHPAMRHAGPVRREIGIRTVFNILGPLTNPAGAQVQLLGVAFPELGATMAEVLRLLGSHHAMIVHGHGGLDEISLSGDTFGLGTPRRPSQGMDGARVRYRPSLYAGRGSPRRRQGTERRHHAPPLPRRAGPGARHGLAEQRRCIAGG